MADKDFNIWWSGCWLKVGKLAAQREYARARKVHGATVEQLLAGRDAYIQYKPDWQQWVHPRTWLHQGRWMDEWGAYAPHVFVVEDWFLECKEIHGGQCEFDQWRHYLRKQADTLKKAAR